jgi:hypothetical protein
MKLWNLGLCLLFCATAQAQNSPLDLETDAARTPLPGLDTAGHDQPALLEIRMAAIDAELKQLDGKHPWAGHYFWGDGLGANLSLLIADQTGFAIAWHGCLGLYGANEGLIQRGKDGRLILDFRWRNDPDEFGNFPKELIPVRWGERRYLIDANDVPGFINQIHWGLEPRDTAFGDHFLQRGDEQRPALGLPALPEQWAQQLRTEPALYRVSSVRAEPALDTADKRCVRSAELRLDALDHRHSPARGIELRKLDAIASTSASVERIDAGQVIARWQRGFGDCEPDDQPPQQGETLSTGAWRPGAGSSPD